LFQLAAPIAITVLADRAQNRFPDYSNHDMLHSIYALALAGSITGFLGGIWREVEIFNLLLTPVLTGLSTAQLQKHSAELAMPSNDELHQLLHIISILSAVDISAIYGRLVIGLLYLACN